MDEEIEHALALIGAKIGRAKFLLAVTTLVAAVAGILTLVDQSIKKQLLAEAYKLQELVNADIRAANRATAKRPAKPAAEGA